MKRVNKKQKFKKLLEKATDLFIIKGYRRTQIADVARFMGVAPGTIYQYVRSKESLFHLLVLYHSGRFSPDEAETLPVPEPGPEETLQLLRSQIVPLAAPALLEKAIGGGNPADARSELAGIAAELYDLLYANRRGIMLLERSALDWPELAALFFLEMRQKLLDRVALYIGLRVKSGAFRATPDGKVAARYLLETLSLFAIHLHFDVPLGPTYSHEATRATVLQLLVDAFCAEAPGRAGTAGVHLPRRDRA